MWIIKLNTNLRLIILYVSIKDLSKQLVGAKGKLIGYHCDVTNNQSVKQAFDWIEDNYGGVNILVSSAGLGR